MKETILRFAATAALAAIACSRTTPLPPLTTIRIKWQSNSTANAGALVGDNLGTVYDCSTFRTDLTVTVNGTLQNSVKSIGHSPSGRDQTQPCDGTAHTQQ